MGVVRMLVVDQKQEQRLDRRHCDEWTHWFEGGKNKDRTVFSLYTNSARTPTNR
jgi:hypothetical protein